MIDRRMNILVLRREFYMARVLNRMPHLAGKFQNLSYNKPINLNKQELAEVKKIRKEVDARFAFLLQDEK